MQELENIKNLFNEFVEKANKFIEDKKEVTIQEIPAKTIKWGKSSEYTMTWEEAKKWCEEQGGRLPTSLELLQAYEDRVEGFKPSNYWSSTEYNTNDAWVQYFCTGAQYSSDENSYHYVRCVFGD